jgi:hypothetical protein
MADLASPIQAFLAIDVITVAARPRFRTVCINSTFYWMAGMTGSEL